jgi:hypothetical protein
MISKIRKLIFIGLLALLYPDASAQQADSIIVSDNLIGTPLKDLIDTIEANTRVRFFFKPEWIRNVTVTSPGAPVTLLMLLNDPLKKEGLNCYTEGSNIYIYPGKPVITELPLFKISAAASAGSDSLSGITETERKYLQGKEIIPIEVLEIGDRKKTGAGSRCIVTGKIVDESNSEPLIGATVYIEELKLGAVTDQEGRFKLVLAPGKYKAIFSFVSMKQQEYYLQVFSDGSVTIKLKRDLIEIDAVKITSNRYDHVRGIQMGFDRITAKATKEIPIAFGEKDLLKVARMLPGVQNVGEGSSGFNVRGSAEDQNMFYINKIPVYNTSHLFGFFTSFNPDIINDFSFYKSNIPASFGGRLSSVFDITTRQGSKKKYFGQGGISPVTAHSSIEIPAIKDKLSVVASFRSSYSDWILKRIRNDDIKNSSAFFYDGSLSANAEINDKNLLKAFIYTSRDRFSLASKSDYDYSNAGASLAWKHVFSSVLSADIAVIYSRYSFKNIDKTNLSTAFTQAYRINHYEARADFSVFGKSGHRIDFGASQILYDLNRGDITPFGEISNRIPVRFGTEKGLESALYASDEFVLFSNLTVLAGLRYSLFSQLGPAVVNRYYPENIRTVNNIKGTDIYQKGSLVKFYSGPEYRLALNYALGSNSSLKASYNRLYQYIFMLRNTIAISPDDKWKLCDYHISPPVADQVSLGYYRDFNDGGIKVSLEVYQKWIANVVEFKDGTDFTSPDPIETKVLQGKQYANGIELMISKNGGRTTGWVSYSYSRSMVRVNSNIPENQINNGIEFPSNYDRPHSLNLVLNYRTNRRLSASANFIYSTGRPITYPVSVYYSEGQELLNFSGRNEYRIPDYARLDLSINLEGNLFRKKPIHSFWMLSLYNALGRDNVYSVYFDTYKGKVQGHKLSIYGVPILTLSWLYKFGNYLND